MKKLTLNKETLRALDKDAQDQIAAGLPPSYATGCEVCWTEWITCRVRTVCVMD